MPLPTFRVAFVIAFLAAVLAAVDTVDVVDRTDDVLDIVLVLIITLGLSLLGSTGGTGGRFFCGVPATLLTALRTLTLLTLLFEELADVVRALKGVLNGPRDDVVVSRARVAVLTVEVVEVWRERGADEDAVRKEDDAWDEGRDEGRDEIVGDVEARETWDVGREVIDGLTDLLVSVTLLLRIVDATERTEAAEERTEGEEVGRVGLAGVRDFAVADGCRGIGVTFLMTIFLGGRGGRRLWSNESVAG